jgi:hypothetical protein
LCLRVGRQSHELRFVHEPAAVIYHRVSLDRQKVNYVLSRCLGEGRSKATLRAVTDDSRNNPLSREAHYLTHTVPSGIAMNVGQFLRGDEWGLARAALLLLAVINTVIAYGTTRLRSFLGLQHLSLTLQQISANSESGTQVGHSDRGAE